MSKIAGPPPRFTIKDWKAANYRKHEFAESARKLGEHIQEETNRVKDESDEIVKIAQGDVDRRLQQRILDLEYWKNELLERQRNMLKEEFGLKAYIERLDEALKGLKPQLKTALQCLDIREKRYNIDLVHDDVQKELLKEVDVCKGVENLLLRTHQQSTEQIRVLRKNMYDVGVQVDEKEKALTIDKHVQIIKEHSPEVHLVGGECIFHPSRSSFEEWENVSQTTCLMADRALIASGEMRITIDSLLEQTGKDLARQCRNVNCAFERKIADTKYAKDQLERQHAELTKSVRNMQENVEKLQKSLVEKQLSLALCQTQLQHRRRRENVEQCRDEVEGRLIVELTEIRQTITNLQEMLNESNASLRSLLRNQLSVESDMNIKSNSIDADDVMCMSIRQSLSVNQY